MEHIKQGVALTGRNTTGPPCSVELYIIRLQAAWRHRLACAREARGVLQTPTDDNDRRWQTPASVYSLAPTYV